MNWEELHFEKKVTDLHTHPSLKSMLFHRNLGRKKKRRFLATLFEGSFWPFSERITFPMLEKGGVDVMLSTAYILEQGWIDDIKLIKWLFWFFPSVRRAIVDPTYFDSTNAMLDEMEEQVEAYQKDKDEGSRNVSMACSVEELRTGMELGDICIVHAIEGAHSLQHIEAGKTFEDEMMSHPEIEVEILNNLEYFFDRGVAYLTLAHFYPNHCAPPVFPYPEYGMKHMKSKEIFGKWDMNKGLTEVGVKVVEKMLELGMLIDICHCTPTARKQIYDLVDHHKKDNCLMATHSGAFAINPDMYNLEDWEIKWLADHGCALGVIFMNYWISPIDSKMGLKYLDQTISHIINVGGENVPAIGTDFDGFTDPPEEITNISELPRFTKYMCATNHYSDDVMEKILGGNANRLLLEGWKR